MSAVLNVVFILATPLLIWSHVGFMGLCWQWHGGSLITSCLISLVMESSSYSLNCDLYLSTIHKNSETLSAGLRSVFFVSNQAIMSAFFTFLTEFSHDALSGGLHCSLLLCILRQVLSTSWSTNLQKQHDSSCHGNDQFFFLFFFLNTGTLILRCYKSTSRWFGMADDQPGSFSCWHFQSAISRRVLPCVPLTMVLIYSCFMHVNNWMWIWVLPEAMHFSQEHISCCRNVVSL